MDGRSKVGNIERRQLLDKAREKQSAEKHARDLQLIKDKASKEL